MANLENIKVGSTTYNIGSAYLKGIGSYSSSDTAWSDSVSLIGGSGFTTANVDATGSPCNNDGVLLNAHWATTYGFQIWGDDGSAQGGLMHRTRTSSGWNSWQTIPLVGNGTTRGCGSATQPVYVGSGGHIEACTAYSSASVNYANSAGAVAWSNVSGRPTAVSSFTNDSGYITSSGSCNYASSAGNADTLDGSHASAFAAASHSHNYLPLSGGTVSGLIQAYRYTVSNSLPAITLDKPGSYAVGIGPDGTNQRIRFGPVNGMSGTSWVSDANQFTFYFDGKVQATNSFVGDLSGTATSATQIQGNSVTFKNLVVYNGSSSTTYQLVCKS